MGAKILIVDDQANQGRALAIGLRLEGFEVATALEGEAALKHLAAEPADIAIVDLMLPGINGLELARRLHALYPGLRVVLTSAYHLSERQLLRADCGIVGFVPKPFALGELAAFLRAKLGAATAASPSAVAASS